MLLEVAGKLVEEAEVEDNLEEEVERVKEEETQVQGGMSGEVEAGCLLVGVCQEGEEEHPLL